MCSQFCLLWLSGWHNHLFIQLPKIENWESTLTSCSSLSYYAYPVFISHILNICETDTSPFLVQSSMNCTSPIANILNLMFCLQSKHFLISSFMKRMICLKSIVHILLYIKTIQGLSSLVLKGTSILRCYFVLLVSPSKFLECWTGMHNLSYFFILTCFEVEVKVLFVPFLLIWTFSTKRFRYPSETNSKSSNAH